MAEFVQQSIEEMIPELEQMERVGLFTGSETRAILRKRKAYEYKLRRKTKQKEDYLQYAQYEMNVLALVRKRREKIGYKHKKVEIDVAIIHRINRLFRLAEVRFQEDIKLWLSHIDFNKKRGARETVSKLYTKMIQIHNKKPALWIAAAKWEVEEGMSMENARSLLQRAIRFNPQSRKLWQEYFRMELLNAEKLRKRREVLGMAQISQDEDMPDVVLEGRIASIVYKKGTEAFNDDVEFCLEFLPICQLFDFTGWLEEDIYTDLQTRHPDSELTWDALAKRPLQRAALHKKQSQQDKKKKEAALLEMEKECWNLYDVAVLKQNTEKMWTLYLQTCLERLQHRNSSRYLVQQRLERTLSVFKRAADQKTVSESMMVEWVKVLLTIGQSEDVEKVLSLAAELYPQSSVLWVLILSTHVRLSSLTDDILTLASQALDQVPSKHLLPIWSLVIEWCMLNKPDNVEKYFQLGLCQSGKLGETAKEQYLNWIYLQNGILQARDLYLRLSQSQPLSLNFFRTYINIESSQPKPKMKFIRQAYEDAIKHFGGADADLWLEFIDLEQTHPSGQPENAGKLHWRAMKMLQPGFIETFTAKYTLLQSGHL